MDREETQHIVRNTILLYFDNFDQKAHRALQSANNDIKNFFLIFVPGIWWWWCLFCFCRFVAEKVSGIEGWPRNFSSQVQRLVEFLPDFASIGKIGLTLTTTSNYDLLFCWVDFNLVGWFLFSIFVSVIKLSFTFHILY